MTIKYVIPKYMVDGPKYIDDTVEIPFQYADPLDIKVLRQEELLTPGVDYEVIGQEVYLKVSVASNQKITIYRETPLDNNTEYPQEAVFDSEKINDAIDKLTMQNQEQAEAIDRAIKLAITASTTDKTTEITKVEGISPDPNKCLKWNNEGSALGNSKYDPDEAFETAQDLYDKTGKDIEKVYKYVQDQSSQFQSWLSQIKVQVGLANDAVKDAQEKVQTAANFSMPDWMNRSEKRKAKTAYQASTNGWLYLCNRVNDGDAGNISGYALQFSLDGTNWINYNIKTSVTKTGRDTEAICVPVPKDYWYKINNNIYFSDYYFVPCVGSTISPEHGGGFNDGYSKGEIDNLLALKMDQVALAAPLSISVVKNTPDNISTLDDGTAYLNQDAFEATYPENLAQNAEETHMLDCNSESATRMSVSCLAEPWSEGELPKVNLRGCNCFLRNFNYGDIIMSGDTPAQTNSTDHRCHSFVLGTLSDDMSFMPRIHVDSNTYPTGTNDEGVQQYTTIINIRHIKAIREVYYYHMSSYYTGSVYMSYPNDSGSPAYGNPPIDSAYCNVIAAKYTYNTTSPAIVKGIYLRKFYKSETDLNPVLAVEPVYSENDALEFEDYVTTFTPFQVALEDLELNCVLYDSFAFKSYELTSVTAGFNVNDYYISHGSLSNKVMTLGEVSESKYLQVKVNPDQFIKGDRGLELKNEPKLFSLTTWDSMSDTDKEAIKFAMVYDDGEV